MVLVKYVPNPSGIPPEIGPDHLLRREQDGGLDPSDEPSVEVARQIVERNGGSLVALSMGPERAAVAVRKAMALGAERGVVVTDDALRGSDCFATARVLAAAIRREPFDLVLAGVESTDGACGTMPMTLAQLLGVPSVTFARRVESDGQKVTIERQTASGYEVVEAQLPALASVTAGVAEPRHPSLREIVSAKKRPLERLSLGDLGVDPDDVAPAQAVSALEFGSEKRAGELVEDPAEGRARIVALLQDVNAL